MKAAGLYKNERLITSQQQAEIVIAGGDKVLNFCANNYLGLATHPAVVAAALEATERFGAGAVSSRLISGHMTPHAKLEARIAEWKHTQSALVFS